MCLSLGDPDRMRDLKMNVHVLHIIMIHFWGEGTDFFFFRLGFDGRTIGLRFDAERRTSLIKNRNKEIFVILTILKVRF